MMTERAISFAPLLPWWGVVLIGALFAAGLALVLWRAPRLFWPRALIAAALLLLLANPVWLQERRAVRIMRHIQNNCRSCRNYLKSAGKRYFSQSAPDGIRGNWQYFFQGFQCCQNRTGIFQLIISSESR